MPLKLVVVIASLLHRRNRLLTVQTAPQMAPKGFQFETPKQYPLFFRFGGH